MREDRAAWDGKTVGGKVHCIVDMREQSFLSAPRLRGPRVQEPMLLHGVMASLLGMCAKSAKEPIPGLISENLLTV